MAAMSAKIGVGSGLQTKTVPTFESVDELTALRNEFAFLREIVDPLMAFLKTDCNHGEVTILHHKGRWYDVVVDGGDRPPQSSTSLALALKAAVELNVRKGDEGE
jgi:hypothetical protein